MTTWTRRTLFRTLVAMLYLYRTGDARTYWIILPKRLKVVRSRSQWFQCESAKVISEMVVNNFSVLYQRHWAFDLFMRSGRVEAIAEKDFRLPWKITGDTTNIKAGTTVPFRITE